MSELLLDFQQIDSTSWVYLSSLLMIGLFFKFSRAWSMRNVDLILLIMLAPGLIAIQASSPTARETTRVTSTVESEPPLPLEEKPTLPLLPLTPDDKPSSDKEPAPPKATPLPLDLPKDSPTAEPTDPAQPESESLVLEPADQPTEEPAGQAKVEAAKPVVNELRLTGFIWLFSVGGVLLLRMLLDPMMVRRPLLEPNLTTGGLTFVSLALFVFLTVNVITGKPMTDDLVTAQTTTASAGETATTDATTKNSADSDRLRQHGPGSPLIRMLHTNEVFSKTLAILAHLAIVIGLVAIGYRHFDNIKTGIGIATLYLMLPYTTQMTGRVDHILPSVFLVWGVLFYRRPIAAGAFFGLATGIFYYPLFLLPLWMSFYWHRGLMRFMGGMALLVVITSASLLFTSSETNPFLFQLQQTFGVWVPRMGGLEGVWAPGGWSPNFRIPILAAFIVLSATFALWPAQKNLGTLLSCSAAIMIATQFWHGFGGGLYLGWYLPLALLTFFRPNLEDRVAISVLGKPWLSRRKASREKAVDKAA